MGSWKAVAQRLSVSLIDTFRIYVFDFAHYISNFDHLLRIDNREKVLIQKKSMIFEFCNPPKKKKKFKKGYYLIFLVS